MNDRSGLTLIEVLAATAVLSAVAASGFSIMRHASRAAARARVDTATAEVIRRWSAEFNIADLTVGKEPLPPWTSCDHSGTQWLIQIQPVAADTAEQPTGDESASDPTADGHDWKPLWYEAQVQRRNPDDREFRTVTTVARIARSVHRP